MKLQELVIEINVLARRLSLYEEKYGVLSAEFYSALNSGQLSDYDLFDETRADFSRWKGIYETWLRRKDSYIKQVAEQGIQATLRVHPAY